jgi:hypothetical protein
MSNKICPLFARDVPPFKHILLANSVRFCYFEQDDGCPRSVILRAALRRSRRIHALQGLPVVNSDYDYEHGHIICVICGYFFLSLTFAG